MGCFGHLATITSASEDAFVRSNYSGRFWLGGFQDPIDTPGTNDNWAWVTGEAWLYTGWRSGEPNDFFGPGSEQALGMDLNVAGNEGWNDNVRTAQTLPNPFPPPAEIELPPAHERYLVEYDTPCESNGQASGSFFMDSRSFAFTAVNTGEGYLAKGQGQLVYPNGSRIHFYVDCLRVEGDTATISGTVTRSNVWAAATPVWFRVVDNGEGAGAAPDQSTFLWGWDGSEVPVSCSGDVPESLFDTEGGNIQVQNGE